MRNPFPPELRTLAFVKRWNVVITNVNDNVATHSFYVALYAYMIANTIEWSGPHHYLLMNALMHDNDESISGDITGTIKNAILDDEKASTLLEEKSIERMGGLIDTFYGLEDSIHPAVVDEVNTIVLAADKLDALLFLILNQRMGNTMVIPALEGGMRSLEASWRALPASKDLLDSTWQTVMIPSIREHQTKGGRGVHASIEI